MKKALYFLLFLCVSIGICAEGQAEPAAAASAGGTKAALARGLGIVASGSNSPHLNARPGKEDTLSGMFAIMDAQSPLSYPEDRQYPGLYLADGTAVRLEGDISRQLAYGSQGQQVTVKGYYFSGGAVPRFVVTKLVQPQKRGE